MPARMTLRILSLALIAAVTAGCKNKTISITTTPPGAKVTARAIRADKQTEPIVLGVTPLKKSLRFDDQTQKFELRLNAPLHDEATIEVAYEPRDEDEFDVPLMRFADQVPLHVYSLQGSNMHWEGPLLRARMKDTLAYVDVVERSVNIKSITRVTANDNPDSQFGVPIVSPVRAQIAYEVADTASERKIDKYPYSSWGFNFHTDIYLQTIGSFARSRLTTGDWSDLSPAFTGDGEAIVFSSNRSSFNHTLWMKRLDGGGGYTKVTSSAAEDIQPSVSREGELVLFVSLPPGAKRAQIWSVRMNGALPSQLTEGTSPRISPDGKKILFLRRPATDAPYQIWVMNADGTNETQLTQNREYEIADANWSPDGKWIVYAANENKDGKGLRNWDIYLMATESNVKTQLTINGSHDDGPMFDHTGQYIYFRSNRGGVWNIWRCEPKR